MEVYQEMTVFNGPIEAFGSIMNCKILHQMNGIETRFLVVISKPNDRKAIEYIFTNESGLWIADKAINVNLYVTLVTILDTYKFDE